ncbi:MAG TPA: hypothetical protein VGA56_04290 [Opitutaceae bacterium]
MPDETEEQIKGILIELTEGMKSPDTRRMITSMERLEALVAQSASRLDPRLRHFLERRSYVKALAFLSGDAPGAPSGACSSSR